MAKQIELPKPTIVPNNWCWIEMGKLTTMKSGYPFDAKRFVNENSEATRPLIRIRDVVRGTTETFTDEECPDEYIITRGEILIGMDGDFNVAKWQSEDALLNQRVCCIKSSSNLFLDDFLFYYLPDPLKKINDATPSVTVKHLSTKTLAITPVPVPPLAEQQRIVDRIESLFVKLDEAKEKAQSVLDSFETRKAAILHKAFTGELTAKWRAEHGVGMDSWKSTTAEKLFAYVTSGSRGWAQYYAESGAVFIRMGNLDHGTIELDMSDIQYVHLPDKAEGQRSLIQRNDILISITADVGMIGFVRDIDFEAYINQHVALARPAIPESAEFIAWYLVSDVGLQQFKNKQRGATKIGLGLNDIRTLSLNMPLQDEQTEIVHNLSSLFDKEQQAKESAEAVVKKIGLLKKSILTRAFRGELGTNDPTEESAVELIKSVLSEKLPKEKPKGKREKKKPEVAFVAKTIMQALSAGAKITPEKLKSETGLLIDDFYDQLKALIDSGNVIETRIDGESYLEAKNEDRQPNN